VPPIVPPLCSVRSPDRILHLTRNIERMAFEYGMEFMKTSRPSSPFERLTTTRLNRKVHDLLLYTVRWRIKCGREVAAKNGIPPYVDALLSEGTRLRVGPIVSGLCRPNLIATSMSATCWSTTKMSAVHREGRRLVAVRQLDPRPPSRLLEQRRTSEELPDGSPCTASQNVKLWDTFRHSVLPCSKTEPSGTHGVGNVGVEFLLPVLRGKRSSSTVRKGPLLAQTNEDAFNSVPPLRLRCSSGRSQGQAILSPGAGSAPERPSGPVLLTAVRPAVRWC
jgi:hypothetical protein